MLKKSYFCNFYKFQILPPSPPPPPAPQLMGWGWLRAGFEGVESAQGWLPRYRGGAGMPPNTSRAGDASILMPPFSVCLLKIVAC